jgi:hypothetical protein
VGSWDLDVLYYWAVDFRPQNVRGEAHLAWVLEGRAIQDVWIMPASFLRGRDSDCTNNMYGTTLRIRDPAIKAWRIRWINPVDDHEERQIGRELAMKSCKSGRGATSTR